MPRMTEAARTARREQIIAAGLACFAKRGYHDTTMADVATQAGVSKGTPYLYFEGKQALFLALYSEWGCGAQQRIDAEVAALSEAERASPRRILRAIAVGLVAQVLTEPEACRVLMEAYTLAAYVPAIAAAVQAAHSQGQLQLEKLITDGVAAGEWAEGTDPALTARMFTASLLGLMTEWHLDPSRFRLEDAIEALAGRGTPR